MREREKSNDCTLSICNGVFGRKKTVGRKRSI